ncbi:MAG TPA: redox-regulated ATPase YchF [Deltaproteobacteria bacterium]|nr:redox-regulated ATPase YchF [Deltaproteobacteria bacterium]
MALQAGIVGLPNVGKSTLFNALTAAGAESANYPFCTIEPNVGVVAVPDPRLEQIASKITAQKIIPTSVEIVDIAGLVRGASRGEGLGNQFLGNIRAVDAILHVVRCFDDPDVTHVDGGVDPLRDIETINLELIFADLESAERRLDKWHKAAKSGDKEAVRERDFAERLVETLTEGQPARAVDWTEDQRTLLRRAQMITARPVLYVCNVDEEGLTSDNAHVTRVREHAAAEGSGVVVLCAKVEAEISELEADDRDEFLSDLGLEEPGLSVLAQATYDLLGLQTYFTAGEKEIRAWTIGRGWTAPQAAGVIHTDFERGFIKAEVYTIPDLLELGSEAAMKAAGRLRIEGKEYVVKDGDVMHFRFNV